MEPLVYQTGQSLSNVYNVEVFSRLDNLSTKDKVIPNVSSTVKPLIRATPKEDKPPYKGQSSNIILYILCTK